MNADASLVQELRSSARDFVMGTMDHRRGRSLRDSLPGYDAQVLRQIAELGWCGILVPEEHGGLGLGFAEMGAVLEELGKGLLGEPLAATMVLAARALLHGDNESLKGRLLPAVAQGTLLPCLAWQEDAGGLDPAAGQTRAEPAGRGVRLSGRKRFVAGAGAADGFLVTAHSPADVGLYWVEAGASGLHVDYEWRADGTPSAVLTLSDVGVAEGDIAASAACGLGAVARAVNEAMVMASAELCGVMKASLERTLEYMRTRVQFGKPIGAFQALQHQAVDLYIQQELAAAVLGEAIQALDGEASEVERLRVACRAKSRAGEAGLRITRESIQLHGAIGIQDECDIGLYLKRAVVLAAWLGNPEAQRRRFLVSAT